MTCGGLSSVAAVGTFVLLGCGGLANSPPGTDAGGAEPQPEADGGAVCDDYYTALVVRCAALSSDPDQQAILRARFRQVCANQIKLPGSGMTPSRIDACSAALDLQDCQSGAPPPSECTFFGSLALDAPCNENAQCASGGCSANGNNGCGTCVRPPTVGDPCNLLVGCSGDAVCLNLICVPVARGGIGAACGPLPAAQCGLGLYCARGNDAGTCAALQQEAGAGCGGPSQFSFPLPGGCKPPLICNDYPMTCQPPLASGTACNETVECANGLACVPQGPQVTDPWLCEPETWVGSGQPCDDYGSLCLAGTCTFAPMVSQLPSFEPDGGLVVGTCQAVIPDGQPCDLTNPAQTCEMFSNCFQGICEVVDSIVCK